MTTREIVRRAVDFENPPRVPICFLNKHREKSDLIIVPHKEITNDPTRLTSEWGFIWERKDNTMGQPKNPPLADWSAFDGYKIPDPHDSRRFAHIDEFLRNCGDKYRIADVGLSGFNRVTFIRGFEATLEDLYVDRERIEKLIDIVFDFECEYIKEVCKFDIDAVGFWDDWGSQAAMLISPDMWREIFKPRYKKQFDLVHSFGKHVFFHTCGDVWDIMPDFCEIGTDILNLNQPDLFGIERMGADFAGKVCFNCPVDHQTVAISGTPAEIEDYVRRLNEHLNTPNGGFIANIEEYSSVGMSDENYNAIVNAFEGLNV